MKKLDVEALLRWAYRDELPRRIGWSGGGGAVAPGFQFADLGCRVDDWSHEPGFPVAMMGEPHRDAVAVEAAVNALCTFGIEWPMARDWLAPDCGRFLADDEIMLAAMSFDLRTLVACRARIGERPDWRADPWRARRTIGPRNKPVVLGITRQGRYEVGACCPLIIEPDPREVVADRAVYSAWYEALVMLASDLANHLDAHIVTPPAAPARPWVDGDPQPTILPDLTKLNVFRPIRMVSRKRAA